MFDADQDLLGALYFLTGSAQRLAIQDFDVEWSVPRRRSRAISLCYVNSRNQPVGQDGDSAFFTESCSELA